MTWLHTTIKLAPSADCWTSPEGDTICPLPGAAAPVAIPPSWEWYTFSDCLPTTWDEGTVACPLAPSQATGTSLDSALVQMASRDALSPRIPDSFFDGAPVDFSGLFVAAALLAGAAASGAALLLAKLRRKNLAKQSVEAAA